MEADVWGDAALAQKAPVGLEGVAVTREEPTELPAEVILTNSWVKSGVRSDE
jgi:hypothetical protein